MQEEKMKRTIALLILLALFIVPTIGFAASPWTDEKTYADRVSGKLQFGLTNVLLGWVALFSEPNKAATNKENMWSGVGKGLVNTVMNEVGGAFQLVTFPIPVDLPLPDNGIQLGK
jgi:hypothetical protein